MKNFVLFLVFVSIVWFSLSASAGVSAAGQDCTPVKGKCPTGCICLENPLQGDTTDARVIIGRVIKAALGVIGAVTLLMFVLGASKWLMSQGNSEKVAEGAKTMMWAAIGTLLVFASYIVVNQLTNLITGAK